MSEHRRKTGHWTVVAVREGGEVHINHGPAFPCFLTLDWCDCCTCAQCREAGTTVHDALAAGRGADPAAEGSA
jgi:hypothetical protein